MQYLIVYNTAADQRQPYLLKLFHNVDVGDYDYILRNYRAGIWLSSRRRRDETPEFQ